MLGASLKLISGVELTDGCVPECKNQEAYRSFLSGIRNADVIFLRQSQNLLRTRMTTIMNEIDAIEQVVDSRLTETTTLKARYVFDQHNRC